MIARFWGARGSIPTFSKETQNFGGNTPCVTVVEKGQVLILDAGSGIKRFGESEMAKSFSEFHILLTHMHLDHIQGLGFFGPLYNPNCTVHIYGPAQSPEVLFGELSKYLSPPLFPVRIRDFAASLKFYGLPASRLQVGPFSIDSAYVIHPGPTLGYRICTSQGVVTYIPDHEMALGAHQFPREPEWTSGYALAKDADLLIHDAQYTPEEYNLRKGWGHSSIEHTLQFGDLVKVKRLALFHHDPIHSDHFLQDMYLKHAHNRWPFHVIVSKEGDSIEI